MADEILIEAAPGETRAAVLRNGSLTRLAIDRDERAPRAGDLVLGQVEALARGLNAAFVDIGDARAGFLNAADTGPRGVKPEPIRSRLGVGDAVVVQVVAGAVDGKGAKLTLRPSLTGRCLVHLPAETGVHWSKRLAGAERRPDLAAALTGRPGGWIVRTAATAAPVENIATEAGRLVDRWRDITTTAGRSKPPLRLLAGPDPIAALVDAATAAAAVTEIIVDGGRRLAALKAAFPNLAGRMTAHAGPEMLFAAAGLEAEIDALFDPVVSLPGGGCVTLTPTPAFLAIDVDAGGAVGGPAEAVAEAVNREAMAAIGRRMGLADLAGAAVIDPLPLTRRAARDRVVGWLRDAFADDDREVVVAGYTALGKIELTRARHAPSVVQQLTAVCDRCGGAGRVMSVETTALAALRAALAEDRAMPGWGWQLAVPSPVADLLHTSAARAEAESRLGRPLAVIADDGVPVGRWRLSPVERARRGRDG